MIINDYLVWAKKELKFSQTASLDAEILLSYVLDWNNSKLIKQANDQIKDDQLSYFKQLVQDRKNGKPIAYIIKSKEFFGRSLFVDERVLIPRPETEELVEETIEYLKKHPEIKQIIDVGTGSGCIAISLALEFPDRTVIGIDNSPKAIKVAEKNKKKYYCRNLTLMKSDLLSNPSSILTPQSSFLIANLPYIGTSTHSFVDPSVSKFEPDEALYAGPDGFDLYRKLFKQVSESDLNIQALFIEMGDEQKELFEKTSATLLPDFKAECKKDLAGKVRMGVLFLE